MDYFYCENTECDHYKKYTRKYERTVDENENDEQELTCPYCNTLMEYSNSFPIDYDKNKDKNPKRLTNKF